MKKQQEVTLEFNNVDLYTMYYSDEERAYFIFYEYKSLNESLYGWTIKKHSDTEFSVSKESVSRSMWDEINRKGKYREYIFAYMIPEFNDDIAQKLITKILN